MTGVLTGPGGKIAHVARFTPAAGAGVAASFGPALAVAAIAFQLDKIQRAIERLSEQVQKLREFVEDTELAGFLGSLRRLNILRYQYLSVGYVPATALFELAGINQSLLRAMELSEIRLRRLEDSLPTTSKNQVVHMKSWMTKNSGDFTKCILIHRLAAEGMLYSELLRAQIEASDHPELASKIKEGAQQELSRAISIERLALERASKKSIHLLSDGKHSSSTKAHIQALHQLPKNLTISLEPSKISQVLESQLVGAESEVARNVSLQLKPDEVLLGMIILPREVIAFTEGRRLLFSAKGRNYFQRDITGEISFNSAFVDWDDWNMRFSVGSQKNSVKIELFQKSKHESTMAIRYAHNLFRLTQEGIGNEFLLVQVESADSELQKIHDAVHKIESH